MRHNTLKLMALTSAFALGFAFSGDAQAQTGSVQASITTSSAITVTAGADLDYGTWFLNMPSGTDDTFTLVLDPVTGLVVDTIGAGADTTVQSASAEIVASVGAGDIVIQTPASASVDMFATITNNFTTSTQLTFGSPTYSLNGAATASLSILSGTPTTITTTGAADDTIDLGGTITVSAGAGITDATHTADIDVTFSY
ncbi:MAG: hypothetical protein ACRBDI_09360 [Alphaproteobacteria bacterium]